jgi:hypothetical protein
MLARKNPKPSQYTSKRPVTLFVDEAIGSTASNRTTAPRQTQIHRTGKRSCGECSSGHEESNGKVSRSLLPDNADAEFAAGIIDENPKRMQANA